MRLVGLVGLLVLAAGLQLLGLHQTVARVVVHKFDDLLPGRHLGVRRIQFTARRFYLVLR